MKQTNHYAKKSPECVYSSDVARKKVLVTWRRVWHHPTDTRSYAASAWGFWERGRLMMTGALKEGSRKGGT